MRLQDLAHSKVSRQILSTSFVFPDYTVSSFPSLIRSEDDENYIRHGNDNIKVKHTCF